MEPPANNIIRATTGSATRSFLSRPFTSTARKSHNDVSGSPKGPLGLTTVYVPDPDQKPAADIIFVHGLNGGSRSTWSKGGNPELFWPREWLPKEDDLHDVRIHTFGYPAGVTRESILSIPDFARSLLAAINDSPLLSRGEKPPIVFVAHSMGGLVVKKAYIIGIRELEFQPIIDRICAIFFLATPHKGASIAQTLSRLTAVVGVRPFVEDLFPQSHLIQDVSEEFPRVSGNLRLFSFYETRPMSIGFNKTLIVDKSSARMDLANERATFLDADHRHVAMYSTPEDPCYISVKNSLSLVISMQRESSSSRAHLAAQQDQETLNRFLGVSGSPEDDIMIHDSVKLPGSCEWLTSKSYYQSWKGSVDSSFMWLRGIPGAGKSVLSSHIVSDLRREGLDCCFFFFQVRGDVKSLSNGCLRSIIWQMAVLHPEILDKLKGIMLEWRDSPMGQIDSHSMWRKIFLPGILKVRLKRRQFWVIDAMDECKDPADMTTFLTRIQEHWPVSVFVTSRDTADTYQKGIRSKDCIQSYTISEDDSLQDISLLLEANLPYMPRLTSSRWPTPEAMAAHILEKSEGCFLWASIVCSELREVISEQEITKVIESTPLDMDSVYRDILTKMETSRFGKAAAKAFLAWTTYAFRPLSVAELQTPVEMDINDKIDDVRRAITRCCGSLLYVDQHEKVQLVHSTAREFLTREGVESEFILTKSEGHRRLAIVCLKFLLQDTQKPTIRARRLGPEPDTYGRPPSPQPQSVDPFTDYASKFLFQHLSHIRSNDEELLIMLSNFLGSKNLLRWIEYIATNDDLRIVYQAGKTINALWNRRAKRSPPVGPAGKPGDLEFLDKWGDDLINLVTKFSGWLRRSPKAIHHLIAPFCPPDSALRQRFANPVRGLNVQGFPSQGWNDCLAIIKYPKGSKPNAVAAGPGYFAVGMLHLEGTVLVYDDTILQEIFTLRHCGPVWRLAFSESGKLLATGGAKAVRIWSTKDGSELTNFNITSLCLSLGFAEEDTVLRVVLKQNQLIEWDVESNALFRDEPATWAADLPDSMQFRTPTLTEIGAAANLLAVVYRGENIVFWDCIDRRIYDTYEKNTGSMQIFGTRGLAEGSTTVRAAAFGHTLGTNLFAATYSDGDLIVYDIESGESIASVEAANTMLLAASNDGRTLAGVDSSGNFTLFEFETLRTLYHVRFDTHILPKGLAFTSDSRRFIEIWGDQCRVWEPTVLLRSDMSEDGSSDTMPDLIGPKKVDHHVIIDAVPEITSVACPQGSNAVFCAMEDGTVFAYDISGPKPEKHLLFVQRAGCPIHLLHFDERDSILACGDRSGRFTARKITRRRSPRQPKTWEIGPALIDARTGGQEAGMLQHILVSSKHQRLLLSTEKYSTLWPVPKQGEGPWIRQVESTGTSTGSRWITLPGASSDTLLLLESTGREVSVYDWATLTLVRTVTLSLSDQIQLDGFGNLSHPNLFVTYTSIITDHEGVVRSVRNFGPSKILLWNCDDLISFSHDAQPRADLSTLPSRVEHIIGIFGARLVLYMADHWIASIQLPTAGSQSTVVEESFVRHFFLPNDWIGSTVVSRMIFGISCSGEILLARRSELAVIKRGLEVTEDGASFNPRRGSNIRVQHGRFPLHNPKLSSSA
ncbi:Vegetative incompatibility protein HET-E-1 [Madurella mycetomatis]|uniref:Vegetative incompatibility protein HET-E-1 n=1 Tax=Madurella mycetomatis TaxID=100816 RepID=A0A175W0L4_9PEZI|nr:Vegetative incompatibility protein HET-E-1 [Madurella mycetomatis]KXX79001.1 Vegetative incompatibility protein HET-E-1 [Madurella mycetomatis]